MKFNNIVFKLIIAVLLPLSSWSQEVIATWNFDGSLSDSNGGLHNATANGTIFGADRTGASNKSLTFQQAYLSIANDDAFNFGTSDFSISFWFKSGSSQSNGSIISKQSQADHLGWNVWYQGGQLSFVAGNSNNHNIVATDSYSYGNGWHHVAILRIGNTASDWKIYVDGVSVASVQQATMVGGDLSTPAPLYIGRRESGSYFTGSIDNVSIYNGTLSYGEIIELAKFSDPVDGCVAKWLFNGDMEDSSGQNHAASVNGAVTFATDRTGAANSAILLTGSNACLSVANDGAFNFGTSNFTASAWFKTASADLMTIISKQSIQYGGWNLAMNSGKILFSIGHGPAGHNTVQTYVAYNDDIWHHVAVVRKGNGTSDIKIYIDGAEIELEILDAALVNGDISVPAQLYIGKRGVGNSFGGFLDDISIYNRALTASEINTLWSSQTAETGDCSLIYCGTEGVGIGSSQIPNGYMLAVKGKVIAEGVKVELQTKWPDYVFDKKHELMTLEELQQFVDANKHLPNVPAASVVESEGIDLGQMDAVLLQKVEELTLYVLQLQARVKELENSKKKRKR